LPDAKCVVHCAGIIDEDFGRDNPVLGFQKAVIGLEALLDKAVKCGVKKFIYISSTHVYGIQAGIITESTPPNPLSNYALAHYSSEQIFRRYARIVKGKLIILRPNAVYGIPQHKEFFQRWELIPFSFPQEAKRYGKVNLKSSGQQKRNFVSTKSIANVIRRLIDGNLADYDGVINVLGAHTESVYDFALRCKSVAERVAAIHCMVERPENLRSLRDSDLGSDFELRSAIDQAEPHSELDNFLERAYEIL
jgi:UDP-glucose 4-epimerase